MKPSSVESSRWIASIVPMTRLSSGGRKPICGMSSREASSSFDP
ncbi:hypothetical protein SCALM49S_06328 [Streptomyces californicus]